MSTGAIVIDNNKMSSDIFFRESVTDGNVLSGNANTDREECRHPSAGHDTRHADQREDEKRHFQPYSEDDTQTQNDDDQDKEADLSDSDSAEQSKTQRQHFHTKTSSDIFFRHSAVEGEVSSGSSSVDRGEILFPSAGHYTRYADAMPENNEKEDDDLLTPWNNSPPDDGTKGERQHFESSPEDEIQPENNEKKDDDLLAPWNNSPPDDGTKSERQHFESSPKDEIQPENNEKEDDDLSKTEKTEVVEIDDDVQNQTDRRHFNDKTTGMKVFSF